MLMEAGLRFIREGKAEVLAPNLDMYLVGNRPEPAHAPVFYNPRMSMDRSLSVAIARAYSRYVGSRGGLVVCEPLAGTGIRSIRYALEVEEVSKVVSGDINKAAHDLAKLNAERNGLADIVEVHWEDANVLLSRMARSGGCDIVDIDPFGSPMAFVPSGLRAVRDGGLLCVTATDVGVLSGRHSAKCLRRYGAYSTVVPFNLEVGLRILLGSLAREALVLDLGIVPLVSYLGGHYYRACLLVFKDRAHALGTLEELGYAYYSEETLERGLVREYPFVKAPGAGIKLMGPLWVGGLLDRDFVIEYLRVEVDDGEARRLVEALVEEARLPNKPYFLIHEWGRFTGREPPLGEVIELARGLGYIAGRTHLHPKGLRVNMGAKDLLRALMLYFGK